MPRRTKKLKEAQKTARKHGLSSSKFHDKQYQILENAGYTWDGSTWEQRDYVETLKRKSGSSFVDVDGKPSGLIRLRVMGHPSDVQKALTHIKTMNLRVIEVSDEYQNRRGDGIRVYVTTLLPE